MGSTFFSLHYHFVFSTKERRPFIKPEWRPRLHAYLGGISRGMNGVREIVGRVEDHVHILASLRPVHCIAPRRPTQCGATLPHRMHIIVNIPVVDELRELLNAAGIEFDEYLL